MRASSITDSHLGLASMGNDAQNFDVIKAEPVLNGFPGVASLGIAQISPSAPLPGSNRDPFH